jgi:hypothetical protein
LDSKSVPGLREAYSNSLSRPLFLSSARFTCCLENANIRITQAAKDNVPTNDRGEDRG